MVKILLVLATIVSVGATAFIILAKPFELETNTINASSLSVASYLADRGKAPNGLIATTDASQFQSLLATAPIPKTAVLGMVDINEKESTKTATRSGNLKSHVTVAVLGDSMIDTLGPDIPHLQKELSKKIPGVEFSLLNYGVAGRDSEYGLVTLTNDYTYIGVQRKALLANNPDIVVIESFAYNHWSNTQSDLDRQWLTISKIIDTIKHHDPTTQIIMAATLAPYCPTYTDGSANLPEPRKSEECATVKKYLQNMVNFATSQDYPLADVYHASLNGKEGNPKYINQGDHIHPSDEGKQLFAQKVATAIAGILGQ